MAKHAFSLPIVALLLGALQWRTAVPALVFREQEAILESPEKNIGLYATHQVHRRGTISGNLDSCLKHLGFLSEILEAHSEDLANAVLVLNEDFFDPNILQQNFVVKTEETGAQRVILHLTGEDVSLFACLSNVEILQLAAEKLDLDVDTITEDDLAQDIALKMAILRLISAYASQTKTAEETDMLTANVNGQTVIILGGELALTAIDMVRDFNSIEDSGSENVGATVRNLLGGLGATFNVRGLLVDVDEAVDTILVTLEETLGLG